MQLPELFAGFLNLEY